MRLWSLHPRYLDSKGLVAVWREGLLAQAVLHGHTRGYTQHPQLVRFRQHNTPLSAIAAYLIAVHAEAMCRGYRFDRQKISGGEASVAPIPLTDGQLAYEWRHLLAKLSRRDKIRHQSYQDVDVPEAHPLFVVELGEIASWEKV